MEKPVLIFDIGGVLMFLDNQIMLENMRFLMKSPPTSDKLLQEIRSSGIGTGNKSVSDLYENFKGKYGMNADFATFLQAWSSHFSPNQHLLDELQTLAGKWSLGICSNTNDEHWAYVDKKLQLGGRFEYVVLSFQCGYEKPDPRMFSFLRKTIGVHKRTERPFFIDDDDSNVNMARECGFNAFLFSNTPEFLTIIENKAGC